MECLPGWVRARVEQVLHSDFARTVGETMATRIALIAIGLVTSVLIARSLGPEGRGLQATIAMITAIGVQFGNLGLHASNTYYVAKKPSLLPTLVGNSLLVGLGIAGAFTAVVGVVLTVWPQLTPVDGAYLWLALAGIPLGLVYMLLQNLLLGTHQVRTYNVIDLGSRALVVAILVVLAFTGSVSVFRIVAVSLASSALAAVWAYVKLMGGMQRSAVRASVPLLREHIGYGFKAYLSAFFAFTVIRADVLLCSYLLGDGPTGLYSIAASMAEMVYMLPVVAGMIAFPRLSATADAVERWAKTKSIAKSIAVATLGLAVMAGVLARPVVRLLYGEAFVPSVQPFVWLLPGIVLLGVNTIFMNFFAAEGMPAVAIWSPGVASLVNIGLNLWLMPRVGIVGAAIASSAAYGLMLLFSLVQVRLGGRST